MELLKVRNLKTYFLIGEDHAPAVDDISFTLKKGETLAIIGESGSGKSVTALSIMRMVDFPGKILGGEIYFNGDNLLKKSEKNMQMIRGNEIAMIYQDPMSTLNPFYKVGKQIAEPLIIHGKAKGKEADKTATALMKTVGIADAETRFHHLPEQFSGGMRQRLMIAMAIACNPKILIADEPTTALDVTIQADILDLLRGLKKDYQMSIILNTHDLGVVAEMADQVVVMYCGKIMEKTSCQELFASPLNPYTQKLMDCIPRMDDIKERLDTIEGYVPHISKLSKGCRFSNRCHKVFHKCKQELPGLKQVSQGHWSRCWLHEI